MRIISARYELVFAVCVLCFLPLSTPAQPSEVTQIRIGSASGGYNELIITRKDNGYYTGDKRIDAQLIANLLAALNSPVVSRVDPANLGITQAWLNANAEPGVKEYAEFYYQNAAPNLQALYLSTFKNLRLMRRLVPELYRTRWTDDYPLVEIEVTKADGQKIVAKSEEQQLFMLPWEVTRRDRKVKTYNAGIARSVAALLPSGFPNRERLSGESLNYVLAQAVMSQIEDKWELLNAENKAGKYLSALKQKFELGSTDINSYHNVDFGEKWINGDPGVENLQATLKRKDFPRNLRIGIALPFKNGEVKGVDTFLRGIDRYLNLTLSVPWLNNLIRSRPDVWFELRFVGQRSFSEKAMQIFAADMRLKGKESLVKEVEAVQNEVSLLAVGWMYNRDYWLVLPDKRVVLWRFDIHGSPIMWESLQSSAWDCSNYDDQCIGTVITRRSVRRKG